MNTDPLEVVPLSAVGSNETRAVESVGEVLPRLGVVEEARRRFVGIDLRTPAPVFVRHSRTERP